WSDCWQSFEGRVTCLFGIAVGAGYKRASRHLGTRRQIDGGFRYARDLEPGDVPGDSNHGEGLRFKERLPKTLRLGRGIRVETDDLADRVGIGPQSLRGRF